MNNTFIAAYLKIILESRKDDYAQQLENKGVENALEMADLIFQYNNPKKEKAALYWLLRGTIRLPEDQYKVDEAFNLIEKQHLDFQKFDNPMSIINREDKSTKRIKAQSQKFDPDKEPTFSNKKELEDGVIVYQVDNSKEGQLAVRKAIDANWGYDKNPWCLAARKSGFDQDEIAQLSEDEQEKLGLYSEDELKTAWTYWNYRYNRYPKRIAFKDGKLLAFCANDHNEITWWNKNDKSSINIPEANVQDDLDFIKKYTNLDFYLITNPKTPKEISINSLIKLSDDKDFYIRSCVAKNKNAPTEVLKKLADDDNSIVRNYVAENPNTPKEVLKKFANNKNLFIRSSVAKNTNVPNEILKKLSNDKEEIIRRQIAENPSTPKEILLKLIDDDKQGVRGGVGRNPSTPKEFLLKLANDKMDWVRIEVAKNKNTPPEALEKLANDINFNVLLAVSKNKNTPKETLEKMTNDKSVVIKRNALKTLEKIK